MENQMKKLLILGLFLISSPAVKADDYLLQKGDYGLRPIKGILNNLSPLCPPGVVCVTNGTVAEIRFQLQGCLDRLGPVSYRLVHNQDNTVDIYLSALNVLNKRSWSVLCEILPFKTKEIPMVNKYYEKEEIRLHFLGMDS